MTLSEQLKQCKLESIDAQKMYEFIRKAEEMERILDLAWDSICEAGYEMCNPEVYRFIDKKGYDYQER